MLDKILGTGVEAVIVVAILEGILAIYSVALACNAKGKALKITHIVLAVFWVALAVLNFVL